MKWLIRKTFSKSGQKMTEAQVIFVKHVFTISKPENLHLLFQVRDCSCPF